MAFHHPYVIFITWTSGTVVSSTYTINLTNTTTFTTALPTPTILPQTCHFALSLNVEKGDAVGYSATQSTTLPLGRDTQYLTVNRGMPAGMWWSDPNVYTATQRLIDPSRASNVFGTSAMNTVMSIIAPSTGLYLVIAYLRAVSATQTARITALVTINDSVGGTVFSSDAAGNYLTVASSTEFTHTMQTYAVVRVPGSTIKLVVTVHAGTITVVFNTTSMTNGQGAGSYLAIAKFA